MRPSAYKKEHGCLAICSFLVLEFPVSSVSSAVSSDVTVHCEGRRRLQPAVFVTPVVASNTSKAGCVAYRYVTAGHMSEKASVVLALSLAQLQSQN